MDIVVDLSRLQFAIVVLYHFLFVPLTLGITWVLVVMEATYLITGKEVYKDMTRFWGKLFGINFALGVTTGITMEFQFGTNWAYYSSYVGDIFGAPLAIEGLMAFFLESTFVGLFFFGWKNMSKKAHFICTFCTALGTNLSAMWILVANGWMQNPIASSFHYENVRMQLDSFWGLFTNPVAQEKFLHTVSAGYTCGSIFVLAISAWYMLKKQDVAFAKKSFRIAAAFGTAAILSTIVLGDESGHGIALVQPSKIASMEAQWNTQAAPASLDLFGMPSNNAKGQSLGYNIQYTVPHATQAEVDAMARNGITFEGTPFTAADGTVTYYDYSHAQVVMDKDGKPAQCTTLSPTCLPAYTYGETKARIGVPWLLGLLAYRDTSTQVLGLNQIIDTNVKRIESGYVAYNALLKLQKYNGILDDQLTAEQKADKAQQVATLKLHQADLGYGLLLKPFISGCGFRNTEAQCAAAYPAAQADQAMLQNAIMKAAEDSIPVVWPVFWAFRIMIACGVLMLLVLAFALYKTLKSNDWHKHTKFLKVCFWALPLPWIAIEFGWFVAEYGRQPWTVFGKLPTSVSASVLTKGDLIGSLIGFISLYTIFAIVEMYLMLRYAKQGPGSLGTGRYANEPDHE